MLAFKAILLMLAKAGFQVTWKILDSQEFGVPQHRERVYIVCIRLDSVKKTFKFPTKGFSQPLELKDILDPNETGRKKSDLAPGASETLKVALKEIKAAGLKAKDEYIFIDVDAGEEFRHWMHGVCPTITKARGRHGYFVTHRDIQRTMARTEIMKMQGLDPLRVGWTDRVCSATTMGEAIGDAMTVNVVGPVLVRALEASGLVR